MPRGALGAAMAAWTNDPVPDGTGALLSGL